MTLTSLSVVVSSEVSDAPALEAAVAIAQREDAHLDVICLGVEVVPMTAASFGAMAVVRDSDYAAAQERATALGRWVQAALPSSVRTRVQRLTLPSIGLAGEIARSVRCSDLAVTARPYGPGHGALAPVVGEALLFGTAGPVLVVPDAEPRADWSRPFRRLALAWNGSDEALRATRLALPFLRQADQVDVVTIGAPERGPDQADPGAALARWLSRHGIRAEVTGLARSDQRKAEMLAQFAAHRGCEALVLGAYGHSRLREMLLGGTTRDLLAEVPLPLITAH